MTAGRGGDRPRVQREAAEAQALDRYVREVAAAAPPFSAEIRARLRVLLASASRRSS